MDVTGEILHGKTSPLRHDSKGVYAGLPQDLPVTRYHSLAGTHASLPDCLEVSSWIASGPDGGKGIIMGVRHKEFLVEGVQFHPESILTAEGRCMLKNFLKMKGGTWAENAQNTFISERPGGSNGTLETNGVTKSQLSQSRQESILERIYAHGRKAVETQKLIPSLRPSDLQASYDLNLSPPQISFPQRLKMSPYSLALMAEIKRASPSKGPIAMSACAPAQARKYASAGASVISILTEPEWFKGSIEDLRAVRQSLEGFPDRPAILRKEFIFDEYQILEARLAGADTILLIVKMLCQSDLGRLYAYSQSLGMEPLVEVNTIEEMEIATQLGAQVIGVNNRNLTNFDVDLDNTSRLMSKVPDGTTVCALSGISGPQDVQAYQNNRVRAVLVGEALMRAADTASFVSTLLGGSDDLGQTHLKPGVLVKICGTRTAEAAEVAIDAGADLIGVILVEGRKRYVSREQGLTISKVVHQKQKPRRRPGSANGLKSSSRAIDYFEHTSSFLRNPDRALLVGVFQNQPLSYILEQIALLQLDIVQLHGSEPIELASSIPVPVIRRFSPDDKKMATRGYHAVPLLDSAVGGTGKALPIESVSNALTLDQGLRIVLAGGLDADNVDTAVRQLQPFGSQLLAVDVSSGVEQDGVQSHDMIRQFIAKVRQLER